MIIRIGETTYDDILVAAGVSIDHNVDGRATASFTLRDDAGTLQFNQREAVQINLPATWAQLSTTPMQKVSVASDWTIYAIPIVTWGEYTSSVLLRRAGSAWTNLGGVCKEVAAVNSTTAYVIGSDDKIYFYDGAFNLVSSTTVKKISVAADGTLYAIDYSSGNLLRWTGSAWTNLSGNCIEVAALSATVAYVIDVNYHVWMLSASTWTQLRATPTVKKISVAADGTLYATDYATDTVLRWIGAYWTDFVGAGYEVAAFSSTIAYAIHSDGVIWYFVWLPENLLYAGLIQSCEETAIPGSAMKFHSIESADFTSMLDWRVVDYAAEDTLPGDAVRDIIEEYLAEEGITEGYIEDGTVLEEISLGNVSAATGLKKLADSQGVVCYLDYDLKLYFHARTLYAADWSIADGSDILSESFQIVRSNPDYRNIEIVTGGYEETDLQTDSFIGDGSTKTFPLAYPVNRISTVTVAGSAKTVGQKGTDAGSYDSYYAIQSETFTFEVAPANGAAIVIEYYGLWKAKAKAEDLTAIATNADRQGVGSGKVEHITSDDSLTSITAAGEYANATLANYAVDGIQVKYRTRRAGLAAGTLQAINYLGVDEDFLITNVSESHKDGDTEYSVSGCFGPVQSEWDLFFRSAFEAIQSSVSEGVDASGVTKLYNFSHTYLDADRPPAAQPDIFHHAPIGAGLAVSDDSWPCFDPADRCEYIEFWRDGACVFRKAHTSVVNEELDTGINSYTYIAPAEALGEIDEVVFWGGDSATAAYGSGVEIYRAAFVKTKTILESYQINMQYLNGTA